MGFFTRKNDTEQKTNIIRATGHQIASTLEFFSGFSIIKKYAWVIRRSNRSLLQGDTGNPDDLEFAVKLHEEERNLLANRILLEAGLYFLMGTCLVMGGLWNAASHAFSDSTIFWIVLSIFAAIVTMTISLFKAWQSSNVRHGKPQGFWDWFHDRKGAS